MQTVFDVLVIGSGGSGLSAALEAKQNGATVAIVSKTYPTHSQTCQAQGGINAAINGKIKSIQAHINDTIKGSHGLYNKQSIEIMCTKASETIKWLDSIGVPFSRNSENNIAQRKFGAASEIRTCFSSDYTGLKILHTLYDQCIKESIPFYNEYQLLNIIKEDKKAVGITALRIKNSEVVSFYAKTIILATGGYGNLYHKYTTNSKSTTADGLIAAYKAGCKLSNLEMIQFHPTAMINSNVLISESARGEGGYLVDKNGERFIEELKPRDEVARAIYTKLKEGNQVYLDMRHIDKDKLLSFMPQEYRLAKEFLDIELDKELLPINPAAHYCMGGIKTNVSCETNLENLYAVGECAEVGLHGANRLGGNSLQEIITFGRIAGENAAKKSKTITYTTPINEQENIDKEYITKIFDNNGHPFYQEKDKFHENLFNNVGLFRKEQDMEDSLKFVEAIESNDKLGITNKEKLYNNNLIEFIEFQNLLETAKLVIKSAINRKESRGAHYRIDFPEEQSSYTKNSLIYLENDKMVLELEDIL